MKIICRWKKSAELYIQRGPPYPTVSTEGLMISCMIDTMEVRDVATSDIPGAFLKTYYNKVDIHIKMEG